MKIKRTDLDWRGLKQKQSLPLEAKIVMSRNRIKSWAEHWDDEVFVAFSGGKDSTALLHLVRQTLGPDVPAVFYDTGLEYPEVRTLVNATPNVVVRRPKMSYRQVVQEHGYPVVSKQTSHMLKMLNNPSDRNENARRLYLTGIKRDGTTSRNFLLAKKWRHLVGAPFKISDACCDVMKKQPAFEYETESGKRPFVGELAYESRNRTKTYLTYGCNAFGLKHPKSMPIAFWTEQDVLQYILDNGLKIASVYGEIRRDAEGTLYTTGEQRTGCIWCMFGAQYTGPDGRNRFQRLAETHPKLYDYCINDMGLGKVMDYVGVNYRPRPSSLPGASSCGTTEDK